MKEKKSEYRLEDISCLYEITKAMASTMDLRECLQKAMDILASMRGMQNGTVTIVSPVTGQLQIEIAHGLTAEARKRGTYKIGEGITGRVVATGQPIVVPQISEEPLFLNRTRARGDLRTKTLSFICVPVKHGKQTIGALSVDQDYAGGIDFEKDLQFLTVLSGLIAQTVVRIQAVNEETERLQLENTKLKRISSAIQTACRKCSR